jgi:P-type Ca2+ transporter type 2C
MFGCVGVKEAIKETRESGIKVMMITGDSKETAVALAIELGSSCTSLSLSLSIFRYCVSLNAFAVGFYDSMRCRALSGAEMESLSVEELAQQIGAIAVFYRTSPSHKVKIIDALKRAGRIVRLRWHCVCVLACVCVCVCARLTFV